MPRSHPHRAQQRWWGVLPCLALLLAACQGPSEHTVVQASAQMALRGSLTAIALLDHSPSGVAAFTLSQGRLTVLLTLTGLAPGSQHLVRLHAGPCQQGGALLLALPSLSANGAGQAALSASMPWRQPQPSTWSLAVDNGPGRTTAEQAQAIACGAIQMRNGQAFVVLGSTADPNEGVQGVAQLALQGTTLVVRLLLFGVQPDSQHAAHIHAGSCNATGPVLLPFPLLVADGQGQVARVLTFPHIATIPAAGWALTVHLGASVSTPTQATPIACGNVRLL